MKRLLMLAAIAILIGCSKPPAGTTYQMTATIVSRDVANNSVNLDNKEVPGKMEAMKMDYIVRGANVGTLPPDGTAVNVTVHDESGKVYVTDVKPVR